ncbi:hypothetical protein JOD57_004083 [Geodermatophilus bullaregiensis]|uniref:hypothetical protein n=1 Tax=Geodermatophilus bullaregiensis TaxID=1564160 RepID=UPI00195CC555|nr:hypothetical protein [Geodermatophilus bullaregiensis]MBM7808246.1 hypothetical protein [Geodermatophilus bullaregiensis]
MLDDRERAIWDGIVRCYDREADEPPPVGPSPPGRRERDPRELPDVPAAVAAGLRVAIVLVLLGSSVPGLAVGAVTALGWLWWRLRPRPVRGARVTAPAWPAA